MTRTKKILLGLFITLGILSVGLYFLANSLIQRYSQQTLDAIAKRGKNQGVVISEPQFRSAGISGIRSAKWHGLYAELQFPGSEAFDEAKRFEVRVGQIDGWLAGGGNISLLANDIEIEITQPPPADTDQPQSSPASQERVTAKRLQCTFPMELTKPMPGLQDALVQIVKLIREGATELPILANGILEFELKGSPVQVGLMVDREPTENQQGHILKLSVPDLKSISDKFEEPLTDAEVELLANNPLRAAQLLRIKDDAESNAASAKSNDDSVPQDAYRHVLWSFLLANKYGADFAKEVTDSHEQGDTGNTPAERDMDYNNNEVGRGYAAKKIRRNDILEKIRSDPAVVLVAE